KSNESRVASDARLRQNGFRGRTDAFPPLAASYRSHLVRLAMLIRPTLSTFMFLAAIASFARTMAMAQSANSDDVVFARDIQPLLAKHCFACHGPDKSEGELRLDLEKRASAELESGAHAIVPGKP